MYVVVRFIVFFWCARIAIGAVGLVFALSGEAGAAGFDAAWEATGVLGMLPEGGPNASGWMKGARLTFGGWLDGGYTYNPGNPGDNFNGTVTFGDRSGSVQLNQAYFYLERPIDQQGDRWDFGGRLDVMLGTDAVFTQAHGSGDGHWDQHLIGNSGRFYQMAIPQAYLELVAPIGTGLRVKGGHFYTILGNETVMAPDNFFYSHTYMMQYGEPFTQTGLLASYAPFDSLSISAGAVTGSLAGGWDGAFDTHLGEWGFLGGLTWSGEGTSFSANAIHGSQADKPGDWSLYSLVLHHDMMDRLHFTLQHDYGWAANAVEDQTATWYGLAPYLSYDLDDDLAFGVRGEWFRDDLGDRVMSRVRISAHPAAGGRAGLLPISSVDDRGNLAGNTYYAITAGLNWKPKPWVTVRPNVRYDWVDSINMFDCSGGAGASVCGQGDQWLMSMDVILML